MSTLGELANATARQASEERQAWQPLDFFSDEMLQAAHAGLFEVEVVLSAADGTPEFFNNPKVQNHIGDTLAEQGIKCTSGPAPAPGDYPTLHLDWYTTRRVAKIARKVRKEKIRHFYLGSSAQAPLQLENGRAAPQESDSSDDEGGNDERQWAEEGAAESVVTGAGAEEEKRKGSAPTSSDVARRIQERRNAKEREKQAKRERLQQQGDQLIVKTTEVVISQGKAEMEQSHNK